MSDTQGIDTGFKLSDDQRLSLYTLMHQWSRNTDLQFNQVISWVEEATQLALAAAPPDPRKDLALEDVAADIVHQILRFDDKCNGAHIVNLQTGAVTTPETRMIEWVTERLAEMRGAKR